MTTFINAAICSKGYNPCQRPVVFDIALPPGHTKEELASDITHEFDSQFWGVPPVPPPPRRTEVVISSAKGLDIELPDNSSKKTIKAD